MTALGLYKTKEEPQKNWWGDDELPGPRAGKEPVQTEKQEVRQIKVPEQTIDRNMPKDQAHLPVDNLRDRVRDAGMFKGKTEDNGIKAPEMKYNPDDYLPEKSWMKDAPFDTPDKTQSEQPQTKPQEQEATEEKQTPEDDDYNFDKEDFLKVFDKPVLADPKYDEQRQKVRKNQAVLSSLGDAITSMGDGMTLGMGGHVVERNFGDNEKYINDFLNYRDDYQKRVEDWDYKNYMAQLKQAGDILDGKETAEKLRQGKKGLDINQQGADNSYELGKERNKNSKYSNETSRMNALTARERAKLARDVFEKENGTLDPVKVKVRTSAGIGEVEIKPNDYEVLVPEALNDKDYIENSGLFEEVPAETDEFGFKVGESKYVPKKGVTRKDIVVDYKRAEIEKNTPEWAQRPSDYVNAGKSKKEEGQTVGDEIVNRAINGGNADSETSVNELIGEGVPEDASRAFIEAIEKGNISSIVNLSDTERKQIDRMLERTDQEPKRVQAAIETLMRTKGFSTSQSEIIARDFIGKGLPGSTQQLPSEEERLNVLP